MLTHIDHKIITGSGAGSGYNGGGGAGSGFVTIRMEGALDSSSPFPKPKLWQCAYCDGLVKNKLEKCPNCGAPRKDRVTNENT